MLRGAGRGLSPPAEIEHLKEDPAIEDSRWEDLTDAARERARHVAKTTRPNDPGSASDTPNGLELDFR